MSEREKAKAIIDKLPEYKLSRILLFLQGVAFDDAMEDEIFCEKLLEQYLNDPDPEKEMEYSLEDCKREWGLD